MPYFERAIDRVLSEWSTLPGRQPLVLRGARQTGKSSSIRRLGEQFDHFIELNLERRQDLALIETHASPKELLRTLLDRARLDRFPDRTLLFLDEIQESAQAVQWLRFFLEDHPEIAVVAAGSLMEVRLRERGFSFPVGRVTFRWLHPLTFLEFLRASGEPGMAKRLVEGVEAGEGVSSGLHHLALEAFKTYLLVGGMPRVVERWVESGSAAAIRQTQSDLLHALREDIWKYRGGSSVANQMTAFDHLKQHLGLRFRYENFAPGAKSREMQEALLNLEGAMLVRRAVPTSSLEIPLEPRQRSAPKLLPLDVGLALAMAGVEPEDLRQLPLDQWLQGRLAEMFVGQQLVASRDDAAPPWFWVSESANANAETDYLLQTAGRLVPVEVKSGKAGKLRSLHQFLWRSGQRLGLRFHSGPYADEQLSVQMPDGSMDYRLLSVPLYLAELASELVRGVGRKSAAT